MQRVKFLEPQPGVLSQLEVETRGPRGALKELVTALLALRVQLVGVQSKRVGEHQVERFTLAELDGGPLRPQRRLELQVAVMEALERLRALREVPGPLRASVVPHPG